MNTLSIYKNEAILNFSPFYNSGMKRFPNNIRYFRELCGLSQEKLGLLVNKKKDTISKWERGEREISLREAKSIAQKLNTTLDDLANDVPTRSSLPKLNFDPDLMLQILQNMTKEADRIGFKIDREAGALVARKIHDEIVVSRKEGYNIPIEGLVFLNLKQMVAS